MEHVLDSLKLFIKRDIEFALSEDELFEGTTYEIYEKETEDLLGICVFDSDGQMNNFHFLGMYEDGNRGAGDMPTIAESFIRTFYPDGLKEYALQSVVDLEEVYLVTFGTKDAKYGLELPGIGFSLTITTGGQVVQFSCDKGPAKILYPETILSEEEAKECYASHLDFELVIVRTDPEIYANGDDTYRLVYSMNEATLDIPASGEAPDLVSEGNEYESIPPQDAPSASLLELIGVTSEYSKLGEKTEDGVRVEKWIHPSIEKPEYIDYEEAYGEQLITIQFDAETGFPTMVYNGERWSGSEEKLDHTTLRQRALDFLFAVYPQADKRFLFEVEEPEEEWQDDEDEFTDEGMDEWDELVESEIEEMEDEEEAVPFYFRYHIDGVPVEEWVTCIQIGIHSGSVIHASVEPVDETVLQEISPVPVLSKQEARVRFMHALRMELSMAHEYDEEGKAFYRPVYLPSFPETVGHVQMIDAESGKAYYVDIGGTLFF